MEPRISSSFIPKKTVSSTGDFKHHNRPMGVFFTFTLLIFLLALVATGGLFLYTQLLKNNIARKTQAFEEARASFAPAQIQELRRLDARLNTANTLLQRHIAPSLFFRLLEESTLQTIQFENLEYILSPEGDIAVTLKGTARNFASVALQSDALNRARWLRDPVFSNLNVDSSGNVLFTVEGFVDPAALSFNRVTEQIPPSSLIEENGFQTATETSATSTDSSEGSSSSTAPNQGNQ